MAEEHGRGWWKRTFPGAFPREPQDGETDNREEDLMMLEPTYQALQRAEEELGRWKTGVEERDRLLTQAYEEIRALKVERAQFVAGVTERDTTLTALYQEIAEKDKAIRGLKERIDVVGQVATEVGSPGEPPAPDQEPGHEDEHAGPPAPPQRLPDDEEVAEDL